MESLKSSKGEELSFEDFEMMAGGGEKTQKQVQFLCPKMNHLSVDEKFSMRTPKVTKKFRFLYNKGVVHGFFPVPSGVSCEEGRKETMVRRRRRR